MQPLQALGELVQPEAISSFEPRRAEEVASATISFRERLHFLVEQSASPTLASRIAEVINSAPTIETSITTILPTILQAIDAWEEESRAIPVVRLAQQVFDAAALLRLAAEVCGLSHAAPTPHAVVFIALLGRFSE
jgi:hypothetical protein